MRRYVIPIGTVVLVEWTDALATSLHWTCVGDLDEDFDDGFEAQSAGFVVHNDSKHLSLGGDMGDNDRQTARIMRIPWPMVEKVTVLRKAQK